MLPSFPHYRTTALPVNFLFLWIILGINYGAIWFFGETPLLATLPIALVGLLALWYARSLKLFIVYLVFAITGALQEAFFINEGLWQYPHHDVWSIPFYLPFVWGNISILAVALFKGVLLIDPHKRLPHSPPSFRRACLFTFFAALGTILALFFWSHELPVLLGAFLLIDFLYAFAMRSLPLAFVGLIAMICGSVGDLVSVMLGIWQYPMGAIGGVPLYIFVGWDIVGLLVVGLYLTLDADDAPFSSHNAARRSQSATERA